MDWTISYGNAIWVSMFVYMICMTAVIYLLLRRQPQEKKRKVLLSAAIFLMAMFYVQRFFMLTDPRFLEMYGSGWDTKIVNLLPLHLCYVSLVLLIAGLALRKEFLLTFCFYNSPVGATMALLLPEVYALDVSVLEPAILMFYLSHGAIAAIYWNMGFLGFARIGWKGAMSSVGIGCILYAVMFVVNVIGQSCGIDSMNYFYSYKTDGNAALEMFWSLLPVPGLYLALPSMAIAAVWTSFVTLCAKLISFFRTEQEEFIRER